MSAETEVSSEAAVRLRARREPFLPEAGLVFALFVNLALQASWLGTSRFSPDSWSYVELARTVFTDHFYRFNTLRNFLPYEHSASFPFGFPIVLGALYQVAGAEPMAGVWLNIGLATTACVLALRLCRQAGIPLLARLALVACLLLDSAYVDEVLAARSIPLTSILILSGLLLVLSASKGRVTLLGALLLGAAVLIRFDALPIALVSLNVALALAGTPWRLRALAHLSLLLAMLPWSLFSWIAFGVPWVSDNGWVASAAHAAFVMDFPAHARSSLFDAPQVWMSRVASNVPDVLRAAARESIRQPLAVVAGILLVFSGWPWRERLFYAAGVGAALWLLPYAMVGYFDQRYFVLGTFLLGCWGLAAYAGRAGPRARTWIVAAAGFTLLYAAGYGARDLVSAHGQRARAMAIEQRTAKVVACLGAKATGPDVTLLFESESPVLAFAYGALTGRRTAMLPNNYSALSAEARKALFDRLEPFTRAGDTDCARS